MPILSIFNPAGASLPYTLYEGKNCSAGIDMKKLAQTLIQNGYSGKIKLQAKVRSATGKVFKAKRVWVLDLDQYNNN